MTAVGTPLWVAPEILRNERYSFKADVYSYGIVLYEILTRKKPYHDSNLTQVGLVYHIAVTGLRPSLPPSLTPSSLVKLTQECWDNSQAARPTFSEVSSYLRSVESEIVEGEDVIIEIIRPPASSPPSSSSPSQKQEEEEEEEKEVMSDYSSFSPSSSFASQRMLDERELVDEEEDEEAEEDNTTHSMVSLAASERSLYF